jgi:anti-anti-sigma regulatory factor
LQVGWIPLRRRIEKAIAPILEGTMQLWILDCADFTYISSYGLRLFLVLQKSALAKGERKIIYSRYEVLKSRAFSI